MRPQPDAGSTVMLSMRMHLTAVAVATLTACGKPPSVSPEDGVSASSTMKPEVASTPAPASDDPPAEDSGASADDPPPPWWTPLPPISLDALSEADSKAVSACADKSRIQEPDVTAEELVSAAKCFADARAFGYEIRMYMHLTATHPDAAQVPEAIVAMGRRYEQIDVRHKAIEAYELYLDKYPKHDDAGPLAKRAVCLARSLEDDTRVEQLLTKLQRNYGRQGYTAPAPAELEELCAGLPPASR